MIGKIVKGSSFAGCVNYLYKGEGKACLIDSNGVDTRSKQSVITDFKDQAWLNPRIKNCVCHTSPTSMFLISMSFISME